MSGWATTRLGYAPYFTLTFFLAFPALTLLPIVRTWIHDREEEDPTQRTQSTQR